MKIKINGLKKGIVRGDVDTFEAISVSKDPEGRYAVVKIQEIEMYFALKNISEDNDLLVGKYVDHYELIPNDLTENYKVDWRGTGGGYCELIRFDPETDDDHRTDNSMIVKRLYVNIELYKWMWKWTVNEIWSCPYCFGSDTLEIKSRREVTKGECKKCDYGFLKDTKSDPVQKPLLWWMWRFYIIKYNINDNKLFRAPKVSE